MDPYQEEYDEQKKPKTKNDIEQHALDKVVALFEKYRDQRRGFLEDKWERNYRFSRGIYEKNDGEELEQNREEVKSRIFVKLVRAQERSAHAAIMRQVFAGDREKFFSVTPRSGANDDLNTKANVLQETLKSVYERQHRRNKLSAFIRSMITYGTAIAKITPERQDVVLFREVEEPAIDPMGNLTTQRRVVREEATSYRPVFQNIDIRNFYVDLYSDDIHSCECIIVRSIVSRKDFMDKVKKGIYFKPEEDLIEKTYDGEEDPKQDRLQAQGISTDGKKGIELLEYWGRFKDGEEWVITIANREHVARLEANPFWNKRRPFVLDAYEEVPGEIYGIGVPELGEGSQTALNALIRAKIDNLQINNNCEYNVDVSKIYNLNKEDFKRYPGKNWLSKNGNAITPILPGMINTDQGEVQALERYIQEETGIPKLLGGQVTKTGQTATEVEAQQTAVSLNIGEISESFEQNVIIPMVTLDYEIIAQFMSDKERVRITDAAGIANEVEVGAEDVIGNYVFKALGTSAAISRTMHNNQIIQFRQAFGDLPADWMKLGRQFFKNLGLKDADEVLPEGGVVSIQQLTAAAQATGMDPNMVQQLVSVANNPSLMKQLLQQREMQEANPQEQEAPSGLF